MTPTNITNKTEAYDYLFYVYKQEAEFKPDLYDQAKLFFTELELKELYLGPDIIFNDCFPCHCKHIH